MKKAFWIKLAMLASVSSVAQLGLFGDGCLTAVVRRLLVSYAVD